MDEILAHQPPMFFYEVQILNKIITVKSREKRTKEFGVVHLPGKRLQFCTILRLTTIPESTERLAWLVADFNREPITLPDGLEEGSRYFGSTEGCVNVHHDPDRLDAIYLYVEPSSLETFTNEDEEAILSVNAEHYAAMGLEPDTSGPGQAGR